MGTGPGNTGNTVLLLGWVVLLEVMGPGEELAWTGDFLLMCFITGMDVSRDAHIISKPVGSVHDCHKRWEIGRIMYSNPRESWKSGTA